MSHPRWSLSRSCLLQHHPAVNHLGLDLPFVLANFSRPPWPLLATRQPHQLPNLPIATVAGSHWPTSTSLSLFQLINPLHSGDFFGVGLEVCPLVVLAHFARFVDVLMGMPFPIADQACTMFPLVVCKAQRGISNIPRLLSLTGWCFPALALVMTIRFRVVGHEREEVCIFMIFQSHVLPARRCLSNLGPRPLTSLFAGGWCILLRRLKLHGQKRRKR